MKILIKASKKLQFYLLSTLAIIGIYACSGPKKVVFEEPIDTNNKKIAYQTKRNYQFEELGISVSNEFDGARLNNAVQTNDSTIILYFDPENTPINKSPYYAFKTWSKEPEQVFFGFNYPEGFEHRYMPKLKKNGIWSVVDSTNLVQVDDQLLLRLDIYPEPQIVAAQEINTSKNVETWYLNNIVKDNDYVRLGIAGRSELGREIPVLDIYRGVSEGKPIIVLLTRQHPPEVTGYFAFQSFLNTIVAETDLSKEFLNEYRVLAFPIVNPDGVDLGHWRHNSNGVDLNRDWSRYRQPEIRNVVSTIDSISKKDDGKLILGLDFHSTYEDVFYTNDKREGTSLPNFIKDWFTQLEMNIVDYSVNEASSNSTKPVSKGWFLYGHGATGITYEIGDHTPKERIKEIGIASANAMMEILVKN